MYKKCRY